MSSHSRAPRRTSVVAAAALALACADSPQAASSDRPYGGSCSTLVVPQGPSPSPGIPQLLNITYDCTLAHLGRTSAVVQQVVSFVGAGPSGILLSLANTTTYTAANGDQLLATFQGTAALQPQTGEVTFVGTEIFQGGNGRFTNASGVSQLEGTASVVTNRGFFSTKGRLSY